jgi:hypothetical protein
MLRCVQMINVGEANADNEKLIRCHAVSFDAGARALSAVKFTDRKYRGHTEGIPVAILAYIGVYHSLRLHHNRNSDDPFCALKTRVKPLVMTADIALLDRSQGPWVTAC